MNDKRDEVVEVVKAAEAEYYANPSDGRFMPDVIADLILSRETELRRKIADELSVISDSRLTEYRLVQYIEKLRGNK